MHLRLSTHFSFSSPLPLAVWAKSNPSADRGSDLPAVLISICLHLAIAQVASVSIYLPCIAKFIGEHVGERGYGCGGK